MNNKKKGEKARATRSGVAVVPVLGPNIYYKAATPSKDLNALRLSDMPQEVLLHIFTFLFVEDLMVVGAVCRDFRAISKDHGLNNSFRPNVNVSFIGSCGAGKSTLVGHLMLLLGEAKQVDIKNAEQAAKDFETSVRPHAHLTFIASRRKIDRERGLTTDNNYLHALGSRHPAGFTLIDTPGHREYFRNTLRGFLQSDMAVWVVDRIHRSSEFYTRADSFLEAPLMIAGSNMRCAVVVVNKMDEREWSTRQYDEIKIQLAQILAKRRVDTKNVIVVPVSAATGWNLVHRTTVPSGEEKPDDIRLTYQGPTLWEAIIKLSNNVRPKALKRPFRLSVVKMWNTTLAPGERRRGLILGTVLQGGLKAGRTVRLSPAPGDMTKSPDITVWGIGHGKQKRSLAAPGCLVALLLPAGKLIPPMPKRGQDGSGWVAYDPKKEPDLLAATRCFVVQLMIFAGKSINPALLPTAGPNYGVGFSPIFHFVSGAFVGRVAAIHETIDVKTKKVIEQNPKTTSGVGRLYTMTITAKCARIIEPYSKNSSFGRFFVTDNSILVGAGVVKYAVSANKTQAWRDLHLPLDSRFGPDRGLQRCTHFGYWGNPRPEIGYIVGHQRHVACAECFLTNVTANPSIIDNAYCPE